MRTLITVLMLMLATEVWGGCMEDFVRVSTMEYPDNIPPEVVQLPYKAPDGVRLYEAPDDGDEYTTTAEMAQILTECLEYVPDGSDINHKPPSCYLPAIYEPPTPTIEPGPITKAQAELDRLKRQTELNHRIKQVLKILKGENQ